MPRPSPQLLIDDQLLLARLEALGLPRLRRVRSVEPHENRSVMVTLTRHGVLRIHRGYAHAPAAVLKAVLAFVDPAMSRGEIRQAQREIVAFPVERFIKPGLAARRRERCRPEDQPVVRELERRHRLLNDERFAGSLGRIRFRISSRMRTRLGEVTLDPVSHRPLEIAISRRHLRDGWEEVERTLLHEMVHQWQGEEGLVVDHGSNFRRKAREVGVEPSAKRKVTSRRKAARYA
ncbi:MAG TPA: SprT-like domain-containing protein [Gemmatimonadales bacterium]